jgi:hypothetical protein
MKCQPSPIEGTGKKQQAADCGTFIAPDDTSRGRRRQVRTSVNQAFPNVALELASPRTIIKENPPPLF